MYLIGLIVLRILFVFYLVHFNLWWVRDFWLGADYYSMLLLSLSIWGAIGLLLVSFKYVIDFRLIRALSITLTFFLVFSFYSTDILGFYVFFELGLLPLLMIVLGWGYQVERVQATYYLFIYTIVGSLPLLVIFLYMHFSSLIWLIFWFYAGDFTIVIMLLIIFCFFIKFPIYFFHLWLPKAHVEAPVGGSIILAAVVLKLRGYGLFRFLVLFNNYFYFVFLSFFVLMGAFFSAFICITQSDIKSLVAYSSIRHMGIVALGLFIFRGLGLKRRFVIILGHGFCSSMLFYLVNFHYERNIRRQLIVTRGQRNLFFYIIIFWFLFLAVNFRAPPFLNLWGELGVFFSVAENNYIVFLIGIIRFIVAAYCVYIYRVILHGHGFKFMRFIGSMDIVFVLSLWHLTPLVTSILALGGF